MGGIGRDGGSEALAEKAFSKYTNALFYLQGKILSLFFDKFQAVETREVIQFGKRKN